MNRPTALRVAAIVLMTLLAYSPALRGGFVWDDDDHVTQNETLRDADGLRRIWLERGAVPQYYPLVHTSFWIEYQLWDLNPTGYHTVNLLLHIAAALLAWRLLAVVGVPGSAIAAALFALHPVAVESVAWITERKNVLSIVFYLAAALAWLRFAPLNGAESPAPASNGKRRSKTRLPAEPTPRRRGSRMWYGAALALFAGALLSKTVTVSLPFAILLVVWWKRGRLTTRDALPLLPFIALGAVLSLNTVWMEQTRVGAIGTDWSFSAAERILIAGRALLFYAAKLAWPASLTFVYPRWTVDASSVAQWLYPLSAVAIIILLWGLRHRIGRGPLTAVLFFAGTLGPALGFVNVYPMRFTFVADHYQYLASLGLLALAAAGLARLRPPWLGYVLPATLAVLTWRQSHVYRNAETLWADTLRKNPGAWLAHNNLGTIYHDRGELDAAIAHYRQAVELKPDYLDGLANLGAVLLQVGDIEEARRYTDRAERLSSSFIPVLLNRGALLVRDGRPDESIGVFRLVLSQEPSNAEALNGLGSALADLQQPAAAIEAFQSALRLRPGLTHARVNLARVLARTGRPDEAAAQLQEVLRAAPANADAGRAMGQVLVAQGRVDDAIGHFRALISRDSSDVQSRFLLGTLLSQIGRTVEAIEHLTAVVRLNPSHAEAHNNLGIVHLLRDEYAEAAGRFSTALSLRSNNPEAHNNLAYALIRLGRRREAVEHLREALRIRPGYEEAIMQLRQLGVSPS